MRELLNWRIVAGLGVLVLGLGAASLAAQPPGPGKGPGPKGPPPPPPKAQIESVRGTVKEATTAPRGEVDGFLLSDGTWLHWPPHLQDRFKDLAGKGERVRATGHWETGPAGDAHFEVQNVTNLRTNNTAENSDFASAPPRDPGRVGPGRVADRQQRLRDLEEQVERLRQEIQRLRREP